MDAVRVPGDVESGVRHRRSVGRRYSYFNRSVLRRDVTGLRHDALRSWRDAELPRCFLPCRETSCKVWFIADWEGAGTRTRMSFDGCWMFSS